MRAHLAAALLGTGCISMLPAPTPMAALKYEREAPKPHKCLIVMLPGRGDHADDFEKHGFIEALRKRPIAADAVAADALYGYYARRNLTPRLKEDVILPAKARGYEQVWLVGISMGGLGSLLYAKQSPDQPPTGMVLLAPFVGDEELIEEIAKAGGPATWKPGEVAPEDYQRDLWRWLQVVLAKGDPKIVLGYGEHDKLLSGEKLLASALPEGRTCKVAGAHDWSTWAKLWDAVLDSSELARSCAE